MSVIERLGATINTALELVEHPRPSHRGPCGPEAGCDALCMDAADYGKIMRDAARSIDALVAVAKAGAEVNRWWLETGRWYAAGSSSAPILQLQVALAALEPEGERG